MKTLYDVRGQEVSRGDEVVLLVKVRGFRGLTDAYLGHAIYLGVGQYGYEFCDYNDTEDLNEPRSITRIKEPECVLINHEGRNMLCHMQQ